MTIALTRTPARSIVNCELTYRQRDPIDYARALEQHRAYTEALTACGAEVITLPPADDLPDSVFVEDTAIVLDELAIITPLGIASRRPEAPLIAPEIARLRPTESISLPATIEGGDVLRIGKTIFVSPSTRTNAAGIEALRTLTAPHGYTVIAVPLRDCLHLKSACTALDDHTILINRAGVDASAFTDYELVDVPPDERDAANVVRVNRYILMNSQFSKTIDLIEQRGYRVCTVDTSEFTKAEAAVTCMSLLFET